MRLACPICRAEYTIDDTRLPAAGANVRCAKCRGVFSLVPQRGEPVDPSGPAPEAVVAPPPPVTASPPPAMASPPPPDLLDRSVSTEPMLPPDLLDPLAPIEPMLPPDLLEPTVSRVSPPAPPPPAAEPFAPPIVPPVAAPSPPQPTPRAAVARADERVPLPPPVVVPRNVAQPAPRTGPPLWEPEPQPDAGPPFPFEDEAAAPAIDPVPPTSHASPRADGAGAGALEFGEIELGDGSPFASADEEPALAARPPNVAPRGIAPVDGPRAAAIAGIAEEDHAAFAEPTALGGEAEVPAEAAPVLGSDEPFPFETAQGQRPAVADRATSAVGEPPPVAADAGDATSPHAPLPDLPRTDTTELEELFANRRGPGAARIPPVAEQGAPAAGAAPDVARAASMVPPVVAAVQARGAAPRRARRVPTWLAVAVLAVLLLIGIGVAAGSTRYGVFFLRALRGGMGPQRPGAKVLAGARARLAEDRFGSIKAAVELSDQALRLDARDDEAQALYTYSVALLARRHGIAAASWTRARAYLPELGRRAARDPEAAKALVAAALLAGEPPVDAAIASLESHVAKAGARDADAWLVLGDAALARGDAVVAASDYGKLEALQPGSARAAHALGLAAARRGDAAAAQRLLSGALAKDPLHLATAVELASLAYSSGDAEQAGKLAGRVLAPEAQAQTGPRERARARAIQGQLLARSVDEHVEASLAAAERELDAAVKEDPDALEPRVALAGFLLDRGAPDRAAALLAPAVSPSRDPRLVAAQARFLAAQGRAADAATLVDGALEKRPNDAVLLVAKGTLAMDGGKHGDADRLWNEAAARDTGAYEPHLAIAQARFRRGDLEGTEKELKAAIERAPAQPRVVSLGADLLLARHDLEAAEAGYRRALTIDRAHGEALLGLARIALERGDSAAARADLRRAVAVSPRLAPAQALYGEMLWRSGDRASARKALESAVALDAQDAASLARLGAIELEAGDRDAAVAHLKSAVASTVASVEVRAWYGRALLARGEPHAAIEQFRKAIELDGRDAAVYLQLGQAHERVGAQAEAIEAYRAAQQRAPKAVESYEALGMLFSSLNRCADALAQLERAMALARQEPRLRVAVADCKVKLGRHGEAIWLYRRVLEADPKQVGLYYKIARAQHEATGSREAMRWYDQAAHAEPANPMPHYYLAFAYKERGRPAQAIAEFREYLRLSPNALDRKDIEREIEDLGSTAEPERR